MLSLTHCRFSSANRISTNPPEFAGICSAEQEERMLNRRELSGRGARDGGVACGPRGRQRERRLNAAVGHPGGSPARARRWTASQNR